MISKLVVAVLLVASVAYAIDPKVCDGNKQKHRRARCLRVVAQVNKLADVPGPACPVPPACPQPNLSVQKQIQPDGTTVYAIAGQLADPNYPACIGKAFLATDHGDGVPDSVGLDCTGTVTLAVGGTLLFPGPVPTALTGTVHCDCCGDIPINAQFQR